MLDLDLSGNINIFYRVHQRAGLFQDPYLKTSQTNKFTDCCNYNFFVE